MCHWSKMDYSAENNKVIENKQKSAKKSQTEKDPDWRWQG